jgi:hypothetical protein
VSAERRVAPDHILAVRLGHGANCSSIGSVVDTLFATAVVGTAVFVALAAALAVEDVRIVGGDPEGAAPAEPEEPTAPPGEGAAP